MARGAPEDGSGGRRPVPPLPRSLVLPGGAVEGEAMLRELPSAVATLVWETFRHLRMWALTPPARRGELFRRGSQELRELFLLHQTFDLDLTAPLAVLVRGMAPGEDISPRDLSWACSCLSDWALGRDARGTALAYMELAALCAPGNPGAAYVAGRLFRSYGEFRQAERWLQRARVVAWRVEEWEVHALALNSLGNLCVEQGSFARAKGLLEKALKSARRNNLKTVEGEVLHDLFVVAVATERVKEAERYARETFEIYRAESHPRLPALAYDVAYFWIRVGFFARSLSVLKVLLPHFKTPHQQLQALTAAARAAGCCGDEALFHQLWLDIEQAKERLDKVSVLAAALIDVALGAANLAEWDHATRALESALRIATERGERNIIAEAETMLEEVRHRRMSLGRARPVFSVQVQREADSLAEDLVLTLSSRFAQSYPEEE